MSGAKKKLAQKEAQAQMGLTEKEKKALKEAAAKKRNTILGVVGGIVIAVLVVLLLVWNSGFFARHTTALEVNGHKYSVVDVNYFYNQLVNNTYQQEENMIDFYKQYGQEMSHSFDPSQDLRTQYVDEAQTQSFHDYFLEQTKADLVQITALADAAKAAGYTLSEDAQSSRDSTLADIDTICRQRNFASRNSYLLAVYGKGMNEKTFVKNLDLNILATDYYQSSTASMTADSYTDEQMKAYYDANTALYNSYDYDYAFFSGQPVKETDDEGNTIEPTDEQKSEAMADAKEKAENLLKDVQEAQTATLGEGESRKTFADVATAYTTDNTVRTRRLAATNFKDSVYADWLMDAARKDGDIEMFESEGNGYYVIQYHNSYFYDEPTVDVRHILIQAETDEDAETNDYNVPIPTQAQMDAAHDEAEELLKQFNLGEKTADAFGALADEHSDDGRDANGDLNQKGGLYSNVYKGTMVENFENWIFDPSRVAGDVGLVENAGPGYYGWHVVYFQAHYDPAWVTRARSDKATADQNAWIEGVEEGYQAVDGSGLSQVGL